jgi:hypothetical protein
MHHLVNAAIEIWLNILTITTHKGFTISQSWNFWLPAYFKEAELKNSKPLGSIEERDNTPIASQIFSG